MVMYDLFNVISLNSIKKQLKELPEDNKK